MHTKTKLLIAFATTLALLFGAQLGVADDDRRQSSGLSAQDQIEDLPVCYALGTDALGRAVNAVVTNSLDSTDNVHEPVFAEGLAFYRKCFARKFTFILKSGGNVLLTVPDPLTRTSQTDAALQWANFVNNTFRNSGYANTQHHMGSILSSSRGNRGTGQAYLIATHAYADAALGVQVVGGTYNDDVVRRRGRWLIKTRTLNITSNVNTPGG
ncbi:MAG: nuclear transport factor 2 family protein [Gammaproteobacteria bacterium]|nr:nuclear transport factor 2 family protein [Gammaproteobacteria bacterium]